MGIRDRLQHAWNAFNNRTEEDAGIVRSYGDFGVSYGSRQYTTRVSYSTERSIVSSVLTRMSLDASDVDIRHVKLDKDKRYEDDVDDSLNQCLTVEANIDQTGQELIQDAVTVMFDKGVAAIVPVNTTHNPRVTGSWDVQDMRVGEVVQWYPRHVKVDLYNEKTGKREHVIVEKKFTAIIVNPFYNVMNQPNSTLQRLIKKLNILDVVDEQTGSGKLDMIIQLPYVIKTEARRQQAEERRKDIEFQLSGSQYGIAYTDGAEKITQLNRPAENNLLKQVEYLHDLLFSQLGITQEILNGTADADTMTNYFTRTIGPIVNTIVKEMKRKFLTKTARSQGHSIMAFRDPFKLLTADKLAEMGDKLTRNKIATSNEMRVAIGWKPSKDPEADKLVNANMPAPSEPAQTENPPQQEGDSQNGS